MKVAIRSGHNYQSTGAKALLDETTEARKVTPVVIKYLKELGHEVLDVTPGSMDSTSDLLHGTNKAKQWGAELFISIHFNKAYNSYDGKIGTEAWVYSKTDNVKQDEAIAQRIVNNLGTLGFVNRGVKDTNKDLHELKSLAIPSVIVEVCFVEATEDVALYRKLGVDVIGKSIAEAIANKKVIKKEEIKKEVKVECDMKKIVVYYGDADVFAAIVVAQKNSCPMMKLDQFKASGLKAETMIQIGGKANEKNRYETFKNAANLL